MPSDLNGQTKNVIKLYKDPDPPERSYFKAQCMHCVDPACVGACMLGALQKREHGIVTYDSFFCSGCRYCQMVCPFDIPKFEWEKLAPKIVKCELCNHRLKEGKQPGCTEVCPRHAVVYGKRTDLLAEARRRRREARSAPVAIEPVVIVPDIHLGVRYPRLKVACAFLSALGAGLLVAMLMNG